MNRYRHLSVIALLVIAFAACSDSTAPGERVPELGSYQYSMSIPAAYGTPTARTYSGTMTITFATEDSIAATWAVSGYQVAADDGRWNADAYLIYADVQDGFISHRLTPREGELACSGALFISVGGGQLSRVDGTCEIRKQ